uniref:POU domain protein n=1 Tax=Parastrongyloides trichosuri TaxID=131310 RepID=A0A0N4Z0R3_PARTI
MNQPYETEKMCEGDYYSDILQTSENVNGYDMSHSIPPNNVNSYISNFGEADSGQNFNLSRNNNNVYSNWNMAVDGSTTYSEYSYYSFQNDTENHYSPYQLSYQQNFTYPINNFNESNIQYLGDNFVEGETAQNFQITELGSPMDGNQVMDYQHVPHIEDLTNYNQTYHQQSTTTTKTEALQKHYDNNFKGLPQDILNSFELNQEMLEVVEFFRSHKESLFGSSNTSIKLETETPEEEVSRQSKIEEHLTESNANEIPTDNNISYDSSLTKRANNDMLVENIEVFASNFKNQRISYGFTQGDVGRHIGLRFGNEFSQTTISRFEALNLSCKNMLKLKPKLEEWLISTQQLFQQGYSAMEINDHNLHNKFPKIFMSQKEAEQLAEIKKVKRQSSNENSKKRRKRTNLDSEQRNILFKKYIEDNRPSEEILKQLAREVRLDVSVVKIWFCNRRQKERRSMKAI